MSPEIPARRVAVLASVLLSRSVSVSLYAPALPDISREFGISYDGAGSIISLLFVGYTLAVLVGGPLSDRVGRRPLLRLGAALNLLATLAVALAPDATSLGVIAFVLGVAGLGDLTATMLLADLGGARSGRVLSLAHGAYAVGAVAIPVLAGLLLEAGVGFRPLYAGAACVNLACQAGLHLADPAGPGRGGGARLPASAFRSAAFVLAFLAMALYVGAEAGVSIWLPSLLRDRFGASETVGASANAAFWAAMMLGRLGLAHVVDRVDRGRWIGLSALGAAGTFGLALAWGSLPVAFAAAVATGLLMSTMVPVIQSDVTLAHPEASGTVLGLLGVGVGVSCALSSWGVGEVAAHVDAATPGERLQLALWMNPAILAAFAAAGWGMARACGRRRAGVAATASSPRSARPGSPPG